MSKKQKKKNKSPKAKHPTLFCFGGSIRYYEDGSMLELHSQITAEEWEIIIDETVKYKIFLECLKTVACPILGETWDEEDDWFRVQLDIAVSRMRNIDPILVAKHNQDVIKTEMEKKMKRNAAEVQLLVEQMREEKKQAILNRLDDIQDDDDETTVVSNI